MENFNRKRQKEKTAVDARMLSWAARMLFIGALVALIIIIGIQQGCRMGNSLEGTFVNSAGSEFSMANDTLIVEQAEGNQYLIHRRTGFRLLDSVGKPGHLQHEAEEWMADYNPENGTMSEKRHGKSISFSADGSVMRVGRRAYRRIN